MSTANQIISVLLLSALLSTTGCGVEQSEETPGEAKSPTAKRLALEFPAASILDDSTQVPPLHLDEIIYLYNRGVSLMEQYQHADAVDVFAKVVELSPLWGAGRLNYAIALLNHGLSLSYLQMQRQGNAQLRRAREQFQKLLEVDPANPHAHFALGMLYRHQQQLREARSEFEAVLRVDPDDPDTHYQLGRLLARSDPQQARNHLAKTLEIVPHHESASYLLQELMRQNGETKQANALLMRFQALKSVGAGVVSGMRYGEMGKYADILRSFEAPQGDTATNSVPAYENIAAVVGFHAAMAGRPGWAGEGLAGQQGPASFGPGVAIDDFDGDGDLDIFLSCAGEDAVARLYRNDAFRFTEVVDSGIDGHQVIGGYFGDYDGDGDPDLYVTCDGPNRLYRNEGNGSFLDVTSSTGVSGGDTRSVGAAWADADHDGDLDIYVANFSQGSTTGAQPNDLWRNNGDGTFLEVARSSGIAGNEASMSVAFLDVDDDLDLDIYVINHRSANRLYINDRAGQYRQAGARFATLADAGPGYGAVVGDVDRNGREDLLLLRGSESPRLWLQGIVGFEEDQDFVSLLHGIGAAGAAFVDVDLDADLDLILLDAGANSDFAHRVLLNDGAGGFSAPLVFGPSRDTPIARGAMIADLDGDGSSEIFVGRAGSTPELWRAPPPPGRHWLTLIPRHEKQRSWIDPSAVGLLAELKAGRSMQVARLSSSSGYLGGAPRRLHFGLGTHDKADYVRLSWPDAVLQSELEVPTDRDWQITKIKRRRSSCPLLFSWDGERFAYITDFLGVGGLGFFLAPGEYAPPDPTENVRIPPGKLVARDGRLLLRLAEPMEEISYVDQVHLLAWDHPEGWEVYPDERLAVNSPAPTGEPWTVIHKAFPVSARDDKNQDVLERLLKIDRWYVEPPIDSRFIGFAAEHSLELDFGETLTALEDGKRRVLYLYGWVEYTYSHVNYAAYQAGLALQAPTLEVPDGQGGWRIAMPQVGYPAGFPRMMTLDISDIAVENSGRLRLRSNMEIYWDQIFLADHDPTTTPTVQRLAPVVATLRHLGYPREYSLDGSEPPLFDYNRLDHGVAFKNLMGEFTPHGDIRELLQTTDDRFVILARGDEIALEFDATSLSKLPDDWERTFVLHADGYCKDMDLYTAHPVTIKPMPHHGMRNYPPKERMP